MSGKLLFDAKQIRDMVKQMANNIEEKLERINPRDVIFIGIMKGSLFLLSDLLRATMMDYDYDVLTAKSYEGEESTQVVSIDVRGMAKVEGKTVVLVDEICDTGFTLTALKERLLGMGASQVFTCVLLDKSCRRTEKQQKEGRAIDIELDVVGTKIPDHFVLGYGMDLDGNYRTVPFIYYNREEEKDGTGPGSNTGSRVAG